ncbi:hypothetical protein J6590_055902 [Homalodisca vitripennis]|nr:hypothetical protein J6590_055902 [Homalodisca vitripennis]
MFTKSSTVLPALKHHTKVDCLVINRSCCSDLCPTCSKRLQRRNFSGKPSSSCF